MMIGAENVDRQIRALEFFVVIRNVERVVCRTSVAAKDDAVFVVAEVGRFKEQRAVGFVGQPELAQTVDALPNFSRIVKYFLALPQVVANAETFRRTFLSGDD